MLKLKDIKFPKKQNITFYEDDRELYYKILELAKQEGRPVQNYLRNLLKEVIQKGNSEHSNLNYQAEPSQATTNSNADPLPISTPTPVEEDGSNATRARLLSKLKQ